MRSSVEEHLRKTVITAGERQGWLGSRGLLVALSGGGDSMAMLCLLRAVYRGKIVTAHLEHGFRGEESERDAAFVADFCANSGIPCFVRRADVMNLRMKGESAEMAGRRIRYEFFSEICESENLSFVATAHNAGDVIETMAHHFFRGTGIAGLSGIKPRRDNIVRPVIECSRDDLRQFLRESGIPWREDRTNDENHYIRNRIRNQLLPWVLENINGSADRAMLGLASESALVSDGLNGAAKALLPLIARDHPFALAAWDAPAARRLSKLHLPCAVREQGGRLSLPVLDRSRLEELCRMIAGRSRGRFQWSGDVEVCVDSASIGWIYRNMLKSPEPARIALHRGDSRTVEWGMWTIELEMRRRGAEERRKNNVWSALMPVASGNCDVRIESAADFKADERSVFCVKIPWWSEGNMPIISWTDETSGGVWMPGVREIVRNEHDYVIIGKVFARKKS
jgi:tRNA(Ile)-lysidine synthase